MKEKVKSFMKKNNYLIFLVLIVVAAFVLNYLSLSDSSFRSSSLTGQQVSAGEELVCIPTKAQFNFPQGVVSVSAGNLYIADTFNQRIRKVSRDGWTTTVAGSGTAGFQDGAGAQAQFNNPQRVAVDSSGNVYVADFTNHRIRKISQGVVSTLAGSGVPGYADGTGTQAQFTSPSGLDLDSSGNVYVADFGNYRIRKITPSGVVTTVAGNGVSGFVDGIGANAQFAGPIDVSIGSNNVLYVADSSPSQSDRVRMINLATLAVTTVVGQGNEFTTLLGISREDGQGNIYVADSNEHRIKKITSPQGTPSVSTLAGTGAPGYVDGSVSVAQFNNPRDVQMQGPFVYVADSSNHVIRRIDRSVGSVSTYAGSTAGFADCSCGNNVCDIGESPSNCPNDCDLPIISYQDANIADLKIAHCGNALCTSGNTITTVDATGIVGYYTSITLSADNLPIVSYNDGANGDLKVVHCGNAACTSGNTITTVDATGNFGYYTSITLSADNLPIVSYYDFTNGDLKVAHCGNALCTSGNTLSVLDPGNIITSPNGTIIEDVGQYTSITLSADNLPIVSYFDSTNGDLKVVHCGNAACTSGNTITTVDATGIVGLYTSITLSADNLPIVSYYDFTNGDLKVAHCGNALCTSGNTITTVDATGIVGLYTSITLSADNLPIVSYYDGTNGDLKVVHCGNAACTSGNTITTVDATGIVGQYTSITPSADNLPIVSYFDSTNGDLKVAHCGNALCTSGNTITTVDATGIVGPHTSITIG